MADTVDDLHAAEDMAGSFAAALAALLAATPDRRVNAYAPLRQAAETGRARVEEWGDYCRPTCQFRANGECDDDPDTCGCPCNHEAKDT